jgi:hypothetical protein
MSIKGFPTQQKLVNGQSSKNEFVTVQPSDENLRNNMDTIQRVAFRVGNPAVPLVAGATTGNAVGLGTGTWVEDTATLAKVGDFVRFETGTSQYLEIPIIETAVNGFRLGARLPNPPVPADTFYILRYVAPRSNSDGSTLISSGPLAFVKDSLNVTVNEDTLIPANDIQLPVKPLARIVGLARIDAYAVPITTAAYSVLVASTAVYITELEVDNTSGKTLVMAFGAPAAEVDKLYIPAKGLSRQAVAIPAGTRITLKALGGDADVGDVNANFFN